MYSSNDELIQEVKRRLMQMKKKKIEFIRIPQIIGKLKY